ncbi:MAG: nitrilase-related carbon-nitrogen hydrolase, partial [Thermodesulfobacteriota bacterium]
MKTLSHLAFLQFSIVQGEIPKNLEQLKEELTRLAPPPGTLVALPEMWATGFVYEELAELSRKIPDLLLELDELASRHQVVLAGSLPWQEGTGDDGVLHNKLFFSGSGSSSPPGIAKQHLFSFWKEDRWFAPGERPVPLQVAGDELIGGLVCYDLRFPEAARMQCRQGAEILLMSAQWPLARIRQWRILLQARAIENQAFIVAANACGRWNDMRMGGHSLIIAPDGEVLL